jgi:hypothetical protein
MGGSRTSVKWREGMSKGNLVHMNIRYPSIHLKMGPSPLTNLKQQRNCNGTGVVSRIIMASFEIMKIVMA